MALVLLRGRGREAPPTDIIHSCIYPASLQPGLTQGDVNKEGK